MTPSDIGRLNPMSRDISSKEGCRKLLAVRYCKELQYSSNNWFFDFLLQAATVAHYTFSVAKSYNHYIRYFRI